MKYRIFIRTWWKRNKSWPNGLEPHCGRKRTLRYADSLEQARQICAEHNNRDDVKYNNPLSRKAEFESC